MMGKRKKVCLGNMLLMRDLDSTSGYPRSYQQAIMLLTKKTSIEQDPADSATGVLGLLIAGRTSWTVSPQSGGDLTLSRIRAQDFGPAGPTPGMTS